MEQQTPLLRKLSPELRNIINELVIGDEHAIDITHEQQPPLTRTCHEIRAECLEMYYSINAFSYRTTSADSHAFTVLKNWLSRIEKRNCAAVRNIKLCIGVDDGLMIDDPRDKENAWTSLFEHMGVSGCSPNLKVRVSPKTDEKLSESFLHMQQVSDDEATQKSIDDVLISLKESLKQCLDAYVRTLVLKYLRRPTGAKRVCLFGEVVAGLDMVGFTQHTVWDSDRELYDRAPTEPEIDMAAILDEYQRKQIGLT